MDRYQFTEKEFNPASAKVRVEAVRKVLQYDDSSHPVRDATQGGKGMYHIASYFDVHPGRHQEFIDAALENRRDSLCNEPATERFEVIRDGENPNRFYLNEVYSSKAAFDTHTKGLYDARFFAAIRGIAEGPISLIDGKQVSGTRHPDFIDSARAKEPSEPEKGHFEGRVTMQRMCGGMLSGGADVVVVFFESGARTRPHIHTTDQVLHFISGTGFVSFPGEADYEIAEGGVFIVPAGSLHMHGATRRGAVCHLAVRGTGTTNWEPDLPAEWSSWRR